MSAPRVLAIWLDAMDPRVMDEMIAGGQLPHLARIRAEGASGELESIPFGFAEAGYSLMLTSCGPQKGGRWAMRGFDKATYALEPGNACRFDKVPPFYATDPAFKVITLDLPKAPVVESVHGIQISNWGCHSAGVPRKSRPAELMGEILARHGEHPAGSGNDHGNLYDPSRLMDLYERLLAGMRKRAAVSVDLMKSQPWDLFLVCLGEVHNGGHYFWNRPECPLATSTSGGWRMYHDICREVDRTIGTLREAAGPDTRIIVFTVEGMRQNCEDIPSFVFLPELLARYSFPGQSFLDFSNHRDGKAPNPAYDWVRSIWSHARRPKKLSRWLRRRLKPEAVVRWERRLGLRPALFDPGQAREVPYQALVWYQPYWPYMKAFALPTNSDGLVRLNVVGREGHGVVRPEEYEATCAEIETLLKALRIPDTDLPAVQEVIRTRTRADLATDGPHLAPADLVVKWHPQMGNQIHSPQHGRWGPVPFHRSGSHTAQGAVFVAGPGIPAGGRLPLGRPMDVGPTILALMGAPPPASAEGRSLWDASAGVPSATAAAPFVVSGPTGPSDPPPRLAMVLCIRNEERFLQANLLYHRALGVDRVYVYLDSCDDRSLEICRAYEWVEPMVLDLPQRPDYFADLNAACMNHALRLARRDNFDWLLAIDPDEFAYGGAAADPAHCPASWSWEGNLPRMLAGVAGDVMMVRLPTHELLPAANADGGNQAFWNQVHFQSGTPVSRELLHPLTGEKRVWTGYLGHREGKSVIRTAASAQAYDSHRWVVEHGRTFPERADYLPLPTVEAGCHLHYLLTSAEHWREKYLKFSHVPAVWPCGTPVEFPKQCWKEAAQMLNPQGAAGYYDRWVALSQERLEVMEAGGEAVQVEAVRKVLEENGFLAGGKLLPLPVVDGYVNNRETRVLHLEDLAERGGSMTSLTLDIGRLSPRLLRGFHPVEQMENRLFRWAAAEAGILLEVPSSGYQALLKMDVLTSLCQGLEQVHLNGEPLNVKPSVSNGRGISFEIPPGKIKREVENWLELRFRPVDTSTWVGETRQLGAPLFQLELVPHPAPAGGAAARRDSSRDG